MKKAIIVFLFVIAAISSSEAASIWKVYSENSYIFIGGTFHMLRTSDFPLPKEYDQAYKNAPILVFETDHEKLEKPETTDLIISKSLLKNKTLSQVVSPKVYAVLSEFCAGISLPMENINQFKPSTAMLIIMLQTYQKLGVDQDGVDAHFYKKGVQDGKTVEYFESVEEQIEFLVSIGDGWEDRFVSHTIADMKKAKHIFSLNIDAWKSGHRPKLKSAMIDTMKKDYPQMYQRLIIDRNKKWMPKIESFLKSDTKRLVLVGAAHLVGEHGLLTLLEQKGYTIEKFEKAGQPAYQ
ncbi:MAG: TraB/GumN family protein [Desulfobacteraceae bacterium]|nr:TraB/GumN family protein [Desulfobacteraceae bacterium]